METTIFSRLIRNGITVMALAASVTPFASCDRLYEDLQECERGARIRFVYDYNMEFANAFPSQVDCLTVLFYDEEGRYVTTRTNMTSDLQDENWRMVVDLEPGTYNIIAYGGMECEDASFSFTSSPSLISMYDIEVELNPSCLVPPMHDLHNLFYGKAEISIEQEDITYRDLTVYMMKDTNNLRILLQNVDGMPIDEADFEFKVTDDNTLMAWDNAVIPTQTVDYLPWAHGNTAVGERPEDSGEVSVAYAEFSFPRLVTSNSPRLVITRKKDGRKVIDIPLINYLVLLKSEKYSNMGSQEFLDRESRWKMLFFLQGGIWLDTVIEINDWVVRLNSVEA